MSTWKAKIETAFYYNTTAYEHEDGEAQINENGGMVVSYKGEDGVFFTIYRC